MTRLTPSSPRRAFTLIEMVTSLVILSVLLLACGSIVGMATRATSDGSTRALAQAQAADAVAQMTDDLNVATNFTERTATAATFTVPDRLSAGSPQTVSYRWSGTAGDPLTRTFNGGTAATVLPGVQSMNLDYVTRLAGPTPAAAEQVIYFHDTVVGTAKDYKLDDKNWGSEAFVPNLPLGTARYTLTRVRLLLKVGAQNTALNVSIRLPDLTSRPTSTVLAQATVYESSLSTAYEWVDVPLSGLNNLSPLQNLCLVLTNGSGTNVGAVQIDQALVTILSTSAFSTTTNAGASWALASSLTSMRYYVFGTVP